MDDPDDAADAGEKYRLEQAAQLIREYEEGHRVVRGVAGAGAGRRAASRGPHVRRV